MSSTSPPLPRDAVSGPAAPVGRSSPRVPEKRLYLRLCRVVDTPLALAVLLGVFVAMNLGRTPAGLDGFLALRITVKNLLLVTAFAACWRLASIRFGLYTWRLVKARRDEALRVIALCTAMSSCALVFPLISVSGAFSQATVLCFWVASVVGLLAVRIVLRSLASFESDPAQDTVIVGSGPRAVSLFHRLGQESEDRRVLGFVDSVDGEAPAVVQERLLGSLEDLESLLMHRAVDEVLIALPIKSRYSQIQDVIRVCERVGVRAQYLADIFEHQRSAPRYEEAGATRLVDLSSAPDGYRLLVKRAVDLLGATLALVVLSPVMLFAVLAVKATSPGPVLFRQERYGYNRRRFTMYKFRTMVANAAELQPLFEDRNEAIGPIFKIRFDPRMTPVGRLLRRTSIDELPQLVNVLIGDMSLVGPRPMSTRDVHRFSEAALMRRFSVRPGISCLWQVSGRSNLGFDDWIALDLQYIDRWSLELDFRILLRTIPAVVKGTGAV